MSVEASLWCVPPEQTFEIKPNQRMRLGVNAVIDRMWMYHFPQLLRQSIQQIAEENQISKWDIIRLLREQKHPEQAAEIRKKYQEHIMYFGCVHGGSPELIAQLTALANVSDLNLPTTVIFSGDLAGAVEQKTIRQKQLFYDYVMNRATPLLASNPDISFQKLLTAAGTRPPPDSPTIRDGVLKLLRFALSEMGEYDSTPKNEELEIKKLIHAQMLPEVDLCSSELNQTEIDELLGQYIHWIWEKNLNSGTWVGTLPSLFRRAYIDRYHAAAQALAEPLLKLKDRGVEIIWVEGNEDHPVSHQVIAHEFEGAFDTEAYFNSLGINCEQQIIGKDGKATYHILVPFFPLLTIETVPSQLFFELLTSVLRAKVEGKTIIMVAHAQLDWTRHYPGQTPTGYNAKIGEALKTLLTMFKPDQLVYPHQHAEMPDIPDKNAKYRADDTVVSYLPLHAMGQLLVAVPDRSGKNRQPMRRVT